jgi:hypothetical protein
MRFLNNFKWLKESPIQKTPFVCSDDLSSEILPPPDSAFWVENSTGDQMVTPDGDTYIFKQ